MILIDTTVIVDVLRGDGVGNAERLIMLIGLDDIALTRFTELELLMGARDKQDWERISAYIAKRIVVDPEPTTWAAAARLHFDLRRNGHTVRSIVDCCIAQIAIERDLTLVHNDRDFTMIAEFTTLKQQQIKLRPPRPIQPT